MRSGLVRLAAGGLLLIVLILGAALRFYDLGWDGGLMAHPDERSTVAFYAPTIEWPASLSEALDPHESPLNPFWDRGNQSRRSYTYGHMPLYLLVLLAEGLRHLSGVALALGLPASVADRLAEANTVPGYLIVGRALVAVSDTFTIWLVYLIARKLYGRWAGVLAAGLSAFTVLQIQLAHFFAVDSISATFTFLALYGALRMLDRPNARAVLLTGLGVGLAVAAKFSALPIVAAPLVALLAVAYRRRRARRPYASLILPLAGTYFVAFLAFAVTSPYVFLDFQAFFQAVVREQGAMVRGQADFPFTRQYRGTLPYLYFIEQQIRWGMGWLLGLAAFAGLAWVTVRLFLARIRPGELVLMSWIVPYFGITGLFLAKFMRYMIPVVPLFTIMGAGLLVSLWGRGWFRRLASGALIAATCVWTLVWATAFVNGVYGAEHPWVQASRWIYGNVPDGAGLAEEHWDDNLPFGLREEGANVASRGYRILELPMYEEDSQEKYELVRERIRRVDYIVLSSNRLYRTIPRLPQRYPMSTRYYEDLFAGRLGFEKLIEFTAYPRLGPLVFNDDAADESFTVYDHPKPIVFRKVRDLSDSEWDALLGGTWKGAMPGYVGDRGPLSSLEPDKIRLPSFLTGGEGQDIAEKTLLLDRPVDELPVVDDFRWNRLLSTSTVGAAVFWWLVVVAVGWVGWPLTFCVFRNLPDRGHALSKSLTLLLAAYMIWLPSSFRLLQNRLQWILAALGLIGVVSLALLVWRRREIIEFVRRRWSLLLLNEALFVAAYVLFVGIRVLNPDLWQPWLGGEKFMDFAFLNATLKSAYFPPYDPYFAGGYLNYYYYGQYAIGLWFKLAGIAPTVAFNLVVPTLFALTVANSFSLGYNLVANRRSSRGSPVVAGALAAAFVAVIGNLDGLLQFVRRLAEFGVSGFHSTLPGVQPVVQAISGLGQVLLEGHSVPGFNYWDPTRVIAFTINEFPFFSFLFADLHPHMINMPFALLFVALLLNVALTRSSTVSRRAGQGAEINPFAHVVGEGGGGEGAQGGGAPVPRLAWLVMPVVLGALAAINTWDFPTYWALALLTLLFAGHWRHGRVRFWRAVIGAGILAVVALALYWPFFAHYQAISVGLGLVDGATDPGRFLSVWGLFLFLVASVAFVRLAAGRSRAGSTRLAGALFRRAAVLPHFVKLYGVFVRRGGGGYRVVLALAVILLVEAIGCAAFGYWVLGLLFLLLIPTLLLLVRPDADPGEQFALLMVFGGLAVLLGTEVFYMKDFLAGGEWKRMNTLFKFGIQVWLLLGVGTAAFLPQLLASIERSRHAVRRWVWSIAFVVLLGAVLVYPVFGTAARVQDRFPGDLPPVGTLDGMAFMSVGAYTWPDESNRIELRYDEEAIRWLMDNLTGTPVIAEAALPYYREGGLRVSSMTGFPTLLGMHQSEQRYDWQVGERDGLAREFFNTADVDRALELIDQLRISYVYIGRLERTAYEPAGIDKFELMAERGDLQVVFRNDEVTIYQVK